MRHFTHILPLLTLSGITFMSGCISVDENVQHSAPRSGAAETDWSRFTTPDGARVVARGKPPLMFIYPGTGRLSVRNVDMNSILFSIELPAGTPPERTQVSIAADGKFTGRTSAGVTDLGTVSNKHTFIITYLPAEQMK